MKTETKGATAALATIPPGVMLPKKRAQIGMVMACAPTDWPKDFPAFEGRAESKGFETNSLKAKMPAKAPYERMKDSSYMSETKIEMWTIKTRAKTFKELFAGTFRRRRTIANAEHKSALNKDGDFPANQTKTIAAQSSKKGAAFFPKDFFPSAKAIEPNNDKCIPLSARIWLRPASLKASALCSSKYEREPVSSASKRPPALPHANIRRAKCKRHKARIF